MSNGDQMTTVTELLKNCEGQEVLDSLSIFGMGRANQTFAELVEVQECMLAGGAPTYAIPLAWVALAEVMGLEVNREGRIVRGPANLPVGLRLPAELLAGRAHDREG